MAGATQERRRRQAIGSRLQALVERSASTMALCGITFFFESTLNRDWTTLSFVRAPREKKLPVVLSIAEFRKILGSVRLLSDRVCLSTLSSCGLRLQEGTHLHVRDIDSARMMIHVRHGKGGKDRQVPLPQRTLELLRQYWVTQRNPVLVFPAPGRGRAGVFSATQPLPKSSLQEAFRHARTHSGIHTPASVHTLRHSWATHLLEAGVHLRLMHAQLGHNSRTTTSVYTPLTARAAQRGWTAINLVMRDL